MLRFDRKQQSSVKQLSFNLKKKKKKRSVCLRDAGIGQKEDTEPIKLMRNTQSVLWGDLALALLGVLEEETSRV